MCKLIPHNGKTLPTKRYTNRGVRLVLLRTEELSEGSTGRNFGNSRMEKGKNRIDRNAVISDYNIYYLFSLPKVLVLLYQMGPFLTNRSRG